MLVLWSRAYWFPFSFRVHTSGLTTETGLDEDDAKLHVATAAVVAASGALLLASTLLFRRQGLSYP